MIKLMVQFKDHRAKWLDNAIVVAGGDSKKSSESCRMNNDTGKFDCVDITPTLDWYFAGVSLAVPSDFCV